MFKPNLALLFAVSVLLASGMITGCAENGPSTNELKTGNPKLSSPLNQLVQAESRGEVVSFAQQHNIELIAKRVRVIVEALPGQIEAARNAVSAVGTLEASDGNLLQAVVPTSGLAGLAELPSIRLIRLPMQAVPGAASSNSQETNKVK